MERPFYYLRMDAGKFYGKEVWGKMPEKDKKRTTEIVRKIYDKFEKRIKNEKS